jgi:2,5-diamino-6-(ribosylamino)-4(3H)-pyrimidinone 5'-phosphate reductase
MFPTVILHNSVSLDGSLTGFEPNMGLHYKLARKFLAEVTLIGSNTVRTGIEMFGQKYNPETKVDFEKPKRKRNLPYWAIIDSDGSLMGLLHNARQFEYCRDVIVFVSKKTPESYLQYLKQRKYLFHVAGKNKVDLKKTLQILAEEYKAKIVMTDTGRILGNLLLEQGLVSQISLLVHPVLVGKKAYNMFGNLEKIPRLMFNKEEKIKGCIWMLYDVGGENKSNKLNKNNC